MITIGVDIGSVAAKAVAFDGLNVASRAIIPTGWSPKETGLKLLDMIRSEIGDDKEIATIIATGYGRVSLPFVNDKVTEITCHGRGAHFIDKDVRTIIDIGGQDSKVIRVDDRGRVVDFIMNDKCAAGTGRFLQVMANVLEVDVGQLSDLAMGARPLQINSMCTVFAESEIVGLLAEGNEKEPVAAGLLESVANRCIALAGRLGVEDRVFFSGGVAKSPYIRAYLANRLNTEVIISPHGQFNGALGAAIIGWERSTNLNIL